VPSLSLLGLRYHHQKEAERIIVTLLLQWKEFNSALDALSLAIVVIFTAQHEHYNKNTKLMAVLLLLLLLLLLLSLQLGHISVVKKQLNIPSIWQL
jgi:hypothetical protein